MHLAVQKPERILKDRTGQPYTREHNNMHDLPSQVVHGEAVLMGDVFDTLDDKLNFNSRMRSRTFSVIRELSKTSSYLIDFLLLVHQNGTAIPELPELSDRMQAFRERADVFKP